MICAKSSQNQLMISRFLKEESEISIQEDFGQVHCNRQQVTDRLPLISVAVHIRDSREKNALTKNLQIQA